MPTGNMAEKQRLFVDMDGTLAVFTPVDELEALYEKSYFLNLKPHENVVAAVKEIIANHPEIEVHILSAYLTDSQYALQEKNSWLDRYLPEIDQAHRVFVPCGSDKKAGIEGGIRGDDFLLDDYTVNLNDWQPPARGIKLLNAINHTRGSWAHDRIRYDRDPADLANGIVAVMQGEQRVFDERIMPTEKGEPNMTINGHLSQKVDEWQNYGIAYVLGQDTTDKTFYHTKVTEDGKTYEYEFDHKPTRDDVEIHHIDFMSERDIDRHETEYGADGRSNLLGVENTMTDASNAYREVETNLGKMPLVDYLDIYASQHGFDSYEDLYHNGWRVQGYEDVTPESLSPIYGAAAQAIAACSAPSADMEFEP